MAVDTFLPAGNVVNHDDVRNRYRASAIGTVMAATPTDVVTLSGAAGKRIRVLRVVVSGDADTASQVIPIQVVKRSTAASGGTSTAGTAVPVDSSMVAASATIAVYTANPTVGTAVGTVGVQNVLCALKTAAGTTNGVFEFELRNGPGLVLNSATESLCINGNGVTLANATRLNWMLEFIEE